jgi:DNA-binding GntR family transcriptional regulator
MLQIDAKPALIDQVYAQIKQAIVTGDLRPSASLAQEALGSGIGS